MDAELLETDKEGYLTRYGYTGQGDVKHIQYADGREVKYSYNPLRQLMETGRLAEKQFPNGMETKYRYDRKGQIKSDQKRRYPLKNLSV